MRLLEEAVILTLKDYGIESGRSDGETGVWLDIGTQNARKICALGVRSSRWVTMHGFALTSIAIYRILGISSPVGLPINPLHQCKKS